MTACLSLTCFPSLTDRLSLHPQLLHPISVLHHRLSPFTFRLRTPLLFFPILNPRPSCLELPGASLICLFVLTPGRSSPLFVSRLDANHTSSTIRPEFCLSPPPRQNLARGEVRLHSD
ncbi:hypothetical protein BJX99DRAFT_88709 [Aspergillus californicus]